MSETTLTDTAQLETQVVKDVADATTVVKNGAISEEDITDIRATIALLHSLVADVAADVALIKADWPKLKAFMSEHFNWFRSL